MDASPRPRPSPHQTSRLHPRLSRNCRSFPPPRLFVHLESVKPFWELDRAFSLPAWRLAISSILAEITALLASLKLKLFDSLISNYTQALERPNGHLDPLPAVSTPPSPAEMDAFFALPTSVFQCTFCCKHGIHYPQIVEHLVKGAHEGSEKAYRLGNP